jgi:uncharacterized protein YeaO (DUF488 family)
MSYLLIIHEVKDFNTWKKGYEDHINTREKATLKEVYLLQSKENPNEVTILFEVGDEAKAKEFAASDELREKMKEVGVVGKPEIKFLEKAS